MDERERQRRHATGGRQRNSVAAEGTNETAECLT
jgi:hypothetical protein